MRCLLSALFVAVVGVMLVHDAAYAQRLGFVTGREPHGQAFASIRGLKHAGCSTSTRVVL